MTTPVPLRRRALTEGWTLAVDSGRSGEMPPEAEDLGDRRVPGEVPGAVHADLRRAGIIDDPVLGFGEQATAWVSHTNWVYRAALSPVDPGADRADLVFDGLDTIAEIAVDEQHVGAARNMHRRYRFPVTELLCDDTAGSHELAVHLASPYPAAEALREKAGPRPNAYPEPFNFIRKMASGFGWDWGITLPGAGIWRPVWLETWSTARISAVRACTDIRDGVGQAEATGSLELHLDIERSEAGHDRELAADVVLDGETVATVELGPGEQSTVVEIAVPRVHRWWPTGYGEPELYDLAVRLRADGALLDTGQRRIGFRHTRLDRRADEYGTRFTFLLDGEPIFIKGINWIPERVTPGTVTRADYERQLRAARDAGCNLIRVWGGGVFESREFYDLCDELGLMVWQDFLFACAAYPEDDELRREVLAEARDNVARLASHPSLILWNGNNENDWLRLAENWAEQPGGEADWGERYYHEDLPAIVAELDPTRPYTPSSPWSGDPAIFPNDPRHQTHHSWDVWNQVDYAHYRDDVPRFVSEFGWQAPPAWRTLVEAVGDDALTSLDSPSLVHRQKAPGGMDKLRRGLEPHVPVPTGQGRESVNAWHFLTQWNQVEAIRTGVLHWRAHWPVTAGTIVWQLNDLWPVISWSAIDGAGRAKPLYHALGEMYADRVLTIEPDGADGPEGLVLFAVNDSDEPWRGEVLLRRLGETGVDAARRSLPVVAAPRSVARIEVPADIATFTDRAAEVILAELDGVRAWWWGCEPADAEFVGAPPHVDAVVVEGGLDVTVTASALLRDFLFQADRIYAEATADRGFTTLLPGEHVTIHVRCPQSLDPAAVDDPWVATDLGAVVGAD